MRRFKKLLTAVATYWVVPLALVLLTDTLAYSSFWFPVERFGGVKLLWGVSLLSPFIFFIPRQKYADTYPWYVELAFPLLFTLTVTLKVLSGGPIPGV